MTEHERKNLLERTVVARGAEIMECHTEIATLRYLLSEARIRLDQHLGMCACLGEACVSACRECNTTKDLVNRIRAVMQGRS